MQNVVCFKSLFLFQLYSPLKKKNLKTPYPCEVCSCVLNFMAIGH